MTTLLNGLLSLLATEIAADKIRITSNINEPNLAMIVVYLKVTKLLKRDQWKEAPVEHLWGESIRTSPT